MHKVTWGAVILLAALILACGGDDEAPPPATEEPADEATATESADGGVGTGETLTSSELPISVTVTAPAGWEVPDDADLVDLFAVIDPGIGYIDFLQPTEVYTYPTEAQSELGGPPADYVAWFNENPFATVVSQEEVSVGGLQGTRLEVTNNDNEPFALFKLSDGSDYDLSYRDHIHADVLDAGGSQIIVICGPEDPANFEDFSAACDDVLETVEFGT